MSINPPNQPDSDVYKTLLESTRAIPWRIDWQTMTFSYIGPQIEALLGWTPQSWVSVDDWVARMHPDDREYVVNFCVSQSRAGVDHEADYRALTVNGDYVWIRDVVHVVREGDEVQALIGFMFDISERKKTEEHLIRLQKQLEEYSFQDGLTGIANRRMFDTVLEREWASAQRSQLPLSLIILDIDFFSSSTTTTTAISRAMNACARWPEPCHWRPTGHGISLHVSAARSLCGCCRRPTRHQPGRWPDAACT